MTDSTQHWAAEVPERVRTLFIKYAFDAGQLTRERPNHKLGWVLQTEEIGPVIVKYAADVANSPTAAADINQLYNGEGILPKVGEGWRGAQSLIGGPNPLTSMLLSGALMGSLGAGSGLLLHKLFPRMFNARTPWAFGLLGGLGGAGGGFLMQGWPALKHYGWRGLFKQQPLQGGPPYPDTAGIDPANYSGAAEFKRQAAGGQWNGETNQWTFPNGTTTGPYGPPPPGLEKMNYDSRFEDVLAETADELGIYCVDADYEKHARAGADFLPQIPTNEWGQVVLQDAFLDNTEKALAAGLPAAASAMRGSNIVSPRDVAKVAVNAGLGYGYGSIGALAAKFMGLEPGIQQGIQRAGLLAGAIRGITGML